MHGLIFLQLQKFAQQQAGADAWEALLREANLPIKSYSAVRTYPDEEVAALVAAASRLLNRPPPAILEAFGEFVAPELLRLYNRLIQPQWKTLDVIENTEQLIHAAVRVGNPGATPPVLDCIRTTRDELQIIYSSERHLCRLARGIVVGMARHFGETITVTDDACMDSGDPFCVLHVMRQPTKVAVLRPVTAADTGLYLETAPLTEAGVSFSPSGIGGSYDFLTPPLRSDEIGRLGEYRVLQLVGQGGMGIVFRADDTRLGRIVALKVMQPQLVGDGNMRQRFLLEARAMAAIRSDHVVTIYEVGQIANLPFLAMEFLEGESLETYTQRVGRLPLPEILRIGHEAALGLAAAHARDLIHRDIKPANLWLEARTGRVKILDFGLARANTDTSQLSQVGVVLGTPAFMAPEQARGKPVDHRVDLFSLGSVLYWLCTNERPFKGVDNLSTLMAVAVHDPQPPQEIAAEVPLAVSDFIMQLLRKEPEQRPASSQAVADELAALMRSVGLPEPSLPLIDR